MNPQEVMNLLEQLVAMTNQASPGGTGPVASVVRTLAQQASADGPLRLFGGQPDVRGGMELFQQHLQAIATLLNTLHDPKVLGEFLHASNFPRAKYELFALHHMQLLVWLQRVQTGMQAGMFKQGPDAQQFLTQIAHAARVLLFQPLLQHIHAVMMTVSKIQADTSGVEVPRSMRLAMQYPAETATDVDRVEWLQLNLLLQFQTVYKNALCTTSNYTTPAYSAGERQLLAGMNQ